MLISIAQMCSSSTPVDNLQHLESVFASAAADLSDLLVLPENVLAMGARFKALCETDWKPLLEALCSMARRHQLNCVAGTLPLPDESSLPKRLATSILIDNTGEIRASYNKIHLFDVDVGDEKGSYRESNYYSAGHTPVMFDLAEARVGMTVCFDLRFPNLFQSYKTMGANMILVPSAFTALTGKKHWEVLLRARAIETQCFIVAPNQVGTHDDGRKTWGHSMVVSPDGDILLEMGEQIGVSSVEVDLTLVEALRKAMPLHAKNSH